ncbi:MAG: hypothetical protein U0Q15_01130 [Kineosporiaceae bacterium]
MIDAVRGRRARLLIALAGAVAFGALAGVVRGDGYGPAWRTEAANLSACWLLVGLLPAAVLPRGSSRNVLRGALVGLLATLLALTAFYAVQTAFLYGQLRGDGPWARFLYEARANRVYFAFGCVTGPLTGALGAVLARRWLPVACGLVLAGELPLLWLLEGRPLTPRPVYYRFAVPSWPPPIVQAAVGVMVLAVGARALWASRHSRTGDASTSDAVSC